MAAKDKKARVDDCRPQRSSIVQVIDSLNMWNFSFDNAGFLIVFNRDVFQTPRKALRAMASLNYSSVSKNWPYLQRREMQQWR